MNYIDILKKDCIANDLFPKSGLFLLNELSDLLNDNKRIDFLRDNEYIKYIYKLVDSIEKRLLVIKLSKQTYINDPVLFNFFFNGDSSLKHVNLEGILKYAQQTNTIHITLSEFIKDFVDYIHKKPEFINLYGFELVALIACQWLYKANILTNREYIKQTTGNHSKQLQKKMIENAFPATEYCLKASEALFIAKELKFEHREKNLIETAKYLIKKAESSTAKKVKERTLSENARKAVKARHKITNQTKEKLLKEYDAYASEMIAKGKIPSKNDFSRKMSEKYGLSFTTIRNNWLKGYEPKIQS